MAASERNPALASDSYYLRNSIVEGNIMGDSFAMENQKLKALVEEHRATEKNWKEGEPIEDSKKKGSLV